MKKPAVLSAVVFLSLGIPVGAAVSKLSQSDVQAVYLLDSRPAPR